VDPSVFHLAPVYHRCSRSNNQPERGSPNRLWRSNQSSNFDDPSCHRDQESTELHQVRVVLIGMMTVLRRVSPVMQHISLKHGTNIPFKCSLCLKNSGLAHINSVLKKAVEQKSVMGFRQVLIKELKKKKLPQFDLTDSPLERPMKAKETLANTVLKSVDKRACSNCFSFNEQAATSMCPCKKVSYCSKECQKTHWTTH